MAREKVDNKLNVVIGTKAQVEADNTIPENSIIVVTDEELTASDIPQLPASKITQDANNRFVTDNEKSTWNGKQDKLVAGDNITIDENNVISASGGSGGGGGDNYFSYFGINQALLRIIKQTEPVSTIHGIKPNFQRETISTTLGTNDLYDGYIGIDINAQSTNTLTITTNAKLLCYRFGPGNDVEKVIINPNTPVVFNGGAGGEINLTLYCLETTGNDSITINFESD